MGALSPVATCRLAARSLQRRVVLRSWRRLCIPGDRPSTSVAPAGELSELISRLPIDGADLVFAYGSGAVKQTAGADLKSNMADFIVAVPDAVAFHSANLHQNSGDYSAMRYFGARGLSAFQRKWAPAKVYFNTMVWVEKAQRLIKYGVIETDDLLADLLDWESLYVAGRLQKPVLTLKPAVTEALQKALSRNLQSAVHTALLLLPDTFDSTQFYTTLASLSYMGDFRMLVGEDKNKVPKLVSGAGLDAWTELYASTLADVQQVAQHDGQMAQDGSVAGAYHHLNLLPKNVLAKMHTRWRQRHHLGRYCDQEEMLYALAHRPRDRTAYVRHAVVSVTRAASLGQTACNALAAGPVNSAKYAAKKLRKMALSLR